MSSIEEDLRTWSREVLEVPNQSLKGLSACPYAKEAWKKDKVLVVETDDVYADSLVIAPTSPPQEKNLS